MTDIKTQPLPPLPILNLNTISVGNITVSSFDLQSYQIASLIVNLLREEEVKEYLGLITKLNNGNTYIR